MGRVDLELAERVINRPHVIDLREDGWTIMHPPACHPDLFACRISQAATRNLEEPPPQAPGRYFCDFDPDGVDWGFVIGEPADGSEGIDWAALVTELRVAREVVDKAPPVHRLLGLADWLDRDDHLAGRLSAEVQNDLRALAESLAAYDRHVQHLDDPGSDPNTDSRNGL